MSKQHLTVPLYSLGCGGGGALLAERTLAQTAGVVEVYVNPATEMAYVTYDPTCATPDELREAVRRAGFGPPPESIVFPFSSPPMTVARPALRSLALAGGLWLAGLYLLCITLDLLFPTWFQMAGLWDALLLSFDSALPGTLIFGLGETFLYGTAGAWSFATLYNTLAKERRP